MRPNAPSKSEMRQYYRALPKAARENLRINATAGAKGLFTTFLPWCAPWVGSSVGLALGLIFGIEFLGAAGGLVLGLIAGLRLIREVETASVQGHLRRLCSAGRLIECPLCGYDQHGTTSSRCTECGCNVQIGNVV